MIGYEFLGWFQDEFVTSPFSQFQSDEKDGTPLVNEGLSLKDD